MLKTAFKHVNVFKKGESGPLLVQNFALLCVRVSLRFRNSVWKGKLPQFGAILSLICKVQTAAVYSTLAMNGNRLEYLPFKYRVVRVTNPQVTVDKSRPDISKLDV